MSRLRLASATAFVTLVATSLSAQSAVPVAQEFESLHFRSIGPAIMSGRISDFAVFESNPAIFYVGTAHGGVWKTTSNGALLTPVLQHDGLLSIGDVTVSQKNPDLVWVGKGEANNRQSTSWGDGVYKSTDGGKTWQMMGLKDSKHIGRILIDPSSDDVVLVAAGGSLFGPGGDRGVYRTTDGGRSWTQTLKTDENTGVTDLARSFTEPNVVYAATYQRRRSTCCMNGGGTGSGLYKSTDGGATWARITGNGWPGGPLGRIGIDTYRKNGNVVYANVEGEAQGGGRGGRGGGAAAPASSGTDATGVYRSEDGGATWQKMSGGNPRPMYFSQIRIDPNNADHIFMGGVDLWMSTDGGRNFSQAAASTIHDDIHAVWIDPSNSSHIMIGGDGGIGISYDHSQTYRFVANLPVGLFYHVGYDMEQPYNVCGGMQDNYDWCGPSTSRNAGGIYNHEWFQVQGGDGFVAIPDLLDSRIVYSESQDGNITRKNKITGEGKQIRPSAANASGLKPGEQLRFHWDTPLMISPNNPRVLLAAANRIFRSNDRGDSWVAISPDLTTNANRDTIVTMGLRGAETRISRDDGVQSWPTIVSMAEHPKTVGVYYAGTDDGNVSMTRDGGKTWVNMTDRLPGFPKMGFVGEIVPSRFDVNTVYVVVDNHRENDYTGHIWVSNDAGKTFRSITGALSDEVTKTLTEDQRNPNVLYVGTETGIFLSLDKGQSWRRLKANFPTVRTDEITLHPRDNAMIVATHGRAIWILDDIAPIQEYTAASGSAADGKLFTIPDALQRKTKSDLNEGFWGHEFFVGENKPTEAVISYFVKNPLTNPLLRITDSSGRKVREIQIPQSRNTAGIQRICWDQRTDAVAAAATGPGGVPMGTTPPGGGRGAGRGGAGGGNAPAFPDQAPPGYMPSNPCGGGAGGFGGRGGGNPNAGIFVMPGRYSVALVSGGKVIDTKPINIIMDPAVKFTVAERARYNAILADLHAMQEKGGPIAGALFTMVPQIRAIDTALSTRTDVPASVKTQFASVKRQFESLAPKFGVPTVPPTAGQGAGAGGGGGRGGAGADTSTYGRLSSLKGQIGGIWETPSASLQGQYNEVKLAMPRLLTEANTFMAAARAVSSELAKYSLTLTVPPR